MDLNMTLSGYVGLHDFSRLVKPSHRNPLQFDKGKIDTVSIKKIHVTELQNPNLDFLSLAPANIAVDLP